MFIRIAIFVLLGFALLFFSGAIIFDIFDKLTSLLIYAPLETITGIVVMVGIFKLSSYVVARRKRTEEAEVLSYILKDNRNLHLQLTHLVPMNDLKPEDWSALLTELEAMVVYAHKERAKSRRIHR